MVRKRPGRWPYPIEVQPLNATRTMNRDNSGRRETASTWVGAVGLMLIIVGTAGCASGPRIEPYPDPAETFIDVGGRIDSRIRYDVRVEYVAQAHERHCRRYLWAAGGTVARSVEFDYSPEIDAGRHAIRVPLMEVSPEDDCQWRARTVYLCAEAVEDRSVRTPCESLFFLRDGADELGKAIELECDLTGNCRSPAGPRTWTIRAANQALTVNLGIRP